MNPDILLVPKEMEARVWDYLTDDKNWFMTGKQKPIDWNASKQRRMRKQAKDKMPLEKTALERAIDEEVKKLNE